MRHQRGQALVEFAIVFPLFLLMLFGFIDLGRWVYTQNALGEATREASRAVTVKSAPSNVCLSTDAKDVCATKMVQARVFAVGGPVAVTTTCYEWAGGVRTAVAMATCATGDTIEVTASVNPWQILTPVASTFLHPSISAASDGFIE